jgi:hypothetical protein
MNNRTLDRADFFHRAVSIFDLPKEDADRIAADMAKLGYDLHGGELLFFLASGKMDFVAKQLPGKVDAAGKRIIAGVGRQIEEKLEAFPALLTDELKSKIATDVVKTSEKLADEAVAKNHRAYKLDIAKIASGALVGGAMLATAAFGAGYAVRGNHLVGVAHEIAAYMQREDWPIVASILKHNDVRATYVNECGNDRKVVQAGAPKCTRPSSSGRPSRRPGSHSRGHTRPIG